MIDGSRVSVYSIPDLIHRNMNVLGGYSVNYLISQTFLSLVDSFLQGLIKLLEQMSRNVLKVSFYWQLKVQLRVQFDSRRLSPASGLTCVFTCFPIVQIKKAESEAVNKRSIRATVEAATAPPHRSNPSETDVPPTHLNPDK